MENAAVSRAAKKAKRAADRADAVKARLPTKGKLRDEKEKTAFYGEQLRFWKEGFFGIRRRDDITGSRHPARLFMQPLECSVRRCIVRLRNMRMTMRAYKLHTRVKNLRKVSGGLLITSATVGN